MAKRVTRKKHVGWLEIYLGRGSYSRPGLARTSTAYCRCPSQIETEQRWKKAGPSMNSEGMKSITDILDQVGAVPGRDKYIHTPTSEQAKQWQTMASENVSANQSQDPCLFISIPFASTSSGNRDTQNITRSSVRKRVYRAAAHPVELYLLAFAPDRGPPSARKRYRDKSFLLKNKTKTHKTNGNKRPNKKETPMNHNIL